MIWPRSSRQFSGAAYFNTAWYSRVEQVSTFPQPMAASPKARLAISRLAPIDHRDDIMSSTPFPSVAGQAAHQPNEMSGRALRGFSSSALMAMFQN